MQQRGILNVRHSARLIAQFGNQPLLIDRVFIHLGHRAVPSLTEALFARLHSRWKVTFGPFYIHRSILDSGRRLGCLGVLRWRGRPHAYDFRLCSFRRSKLRYPFHRSTLRNLYRSARLYQRRLCGDW